MKQFNRIILGVILTWFLLAGISGSLIYSSSKKQNNEYLVEINRIQD